VGEGSESTNDYPLHHAIADARACNAAFAAFSNRPPIEIEKLDALWDDNAREIGKTPPGGNFGSWSGNCPRAFRQDGDEPYYATDDGCAHLHFWWRGRYLGRLPWGAGPHGVYNFPKAHEITEIAVVRRYHKLTGLEDQIIAYERFLKENQVSQKANVAQAKEAVAHYIDHDIPVFLWGDVGIGKSEAVAQVAADRGWLAETGSFIDLRALLLDPVDLRGLPHFKDGKAHWAPPICLPHEGLNPPEGLLFLDELNAAPPSTQAACFQLILNRRLGEYHMPRGWRIVAAGNRQKDRSAAQAMPRALANRFAHLDVEPELGPWVKWAMAAGVDYRLIGFLRLRGDLLHKVGDDVRAFPTPRAWARVSKVLDAPSAVRGRLISGLVGDSSAGEFMQYLCHYDEIPTFEEIVANPQTVRVPPQMDRRVALAGMIVHHLTPETIVACGEFVARLPDDLRMTLIVDVSNVKPEIAKLPAFEVWGESKKK